MTRSDTFEKNRLRIEVQSAIMRCIINIYYILYIDIDTVIIDVTFINNLIRSGNYRERFAKHHKLLTSISTGDFTNSEL